MSTRKKEEAMCLYEDLYNKIKEDITSGYLAAHSRLPSKRKMAERAGVSITTVENAYGQLLSEGFIISKPKQGYYVSELDMLPRATRKDAPLTREIKKKDSPTKIDFSINGVDKTCFPYSTWRKIMRKVFDESNERLLSRSPFFGEEPLREALVPYLYETKGFAPSPDDIIVGAGTDNLLQMLSYALDPSFKIAMENPVYNKSFNYFNIMGHNVLSIDIDQFGMPTQPLLKYENIVAYLTPAHQFPLGITMPISRRIDFLNWANQGKNRYILEDDYDGEFRYISKPIPPMKSIDEKEKVIYIGTFSRNVSPALRISYMILPKALNKKLKERVSFMSSSVSTHDQLVLAEFLTKGHLERHVNKMRKIYKSKRLFLASKIEKEFKDALRVHGENAGQHLLVQHLGGLSEEDMVARALEVGVRVYPLSPYYMGEVPEKYKSTVLLGYATLTEDELDEGVHLLKKIW